MYSWRAGDILAWFTRQPKALGAVTVRLWRGITDIKSEDWWKAVVLYEGYRDPEIGGFLWQQQDDDWRRQQTDVICPSNPGTRTPGVVPASVPSQQN